MRHDEITTERVNAFKSVVKIMCDVDGNNKLGMKIHKTTKDILLTFQYLGGGGTKRSTR